MRIQIGHQGYKGKVIILVEPDKVQRVSITKLDILSCPHCKINIHHDLGIDATKVLEMHSTTCEKWPEKSPKQSNFFSKTRLSLFNH